MEDSRAVALLRYANFAKVAKALGVSRASVADWAKGQGVSPYRLRQLEELLGTQEEAAPPQWAERLANETAMKVIAALLDPGLLEQLPNAMAALRAPQQPGVGTPPANGAIRGRGRSKR